MPWSFQVCLLSGEVLTTSIDAGVSIEDLRFEIQRQIGSAYVHLTSGDGVKLRGAIPLSEAGLKDGDQIYVVVPGHVRVKAHKFGMGFAAIKPDGSVQVWGFPHYCTLFTKTKEKLKDVQEVFCTETAFAFLLGDGKVIITGDDFGGGSFTCRDMNDIGRPDQMNLEEQLVDLVTIEANSAAFAALRADGKVIGWGNPRSGGGLYSDSLQSELVGIRKVFASKDAFAAIKEDGSVVCWGDPDGGGHITPKVKSQLQGVKHIVASVSAFAAIRQDGEVVTWGDPDAGGNSEIVQAKLRKVKRVYTSKFAFAAVREDGTVVTWGPAEHGGDSSSVESNLTGVHHIEASKSAFAAISVQANVDASKGVQVQLRSRVVTWGDPMHGGDSNAVSDRLIDVIEIRATKHAFAALRSDGQVVVWGHPVYGGDASAVQDQLVKVETLYSSQSSFAALRSDGRVVTWGHQDDMCDDPDLQKRLVDVEYVSASKLALAAVRKDGTIVTWGSPDHGGHLEE